MLNTKNPINLLKIFNADATLHSALHTVVSAINKCITPLAVFKH